MLQNKIPNMETTKRGRHTARSVAWAPVPAYEKKDGSGAGVAAGLQHCRRGGVVTRSSTSDLPVLDECLVTTPVDSVVTYDDLNKADPPAATSWSDKKKMKL